ncbi:hypothetical protein QMG83_15275 [Salinibacterium sp. G-O1]|uniref:hypothetical protein n=1 Tax=Salinibacterium sp. G-O1 TaxID=3046208 RepID=UPI0024BADB57|nr:hypothetical protein [Salinibacterium sp. G-O1]MDJ0336589.1 hypothetical protein [Salinibacterium sp. G-O1]
MIFGVIAFPMALILGLVLAVTSLGAPAGACTPSAGTVDGVTIPADATVGGFGREQLLNAAAITNAAAAAKLPAAAQALGVQAAIGESSLVNLNYGDQAMNPDGSTADSIGLFQQQSSWGTAAQRLDPSTAAVLFFQRLAAVPNWETLDPSIAISSVQINADPYHYTQYRAIAVAITSYLATLSPGAGGSDGCRVSGNAVVLAQGLVVAMENGSLTLLEPRYASQITNMANGTATADCTIDVSVLQTITLVLNHFPRVGVSDLNRKCAGDNLGTLAHWAKGGGNAVDFYSLNGAALDGATPDNLALLDLLSAVVPAGTRAGQANCRPVRTWQNITQIADSCNHQHIDFLFTDGPLNVSS